MIKFEILGGENCGRFSISYCPTASRYRRPDLFTIFAEISSNSRHGGFRLGPSNHQKIEESQCVEIEAGVFVHSKESQFDYQLTVFLRSILKPTNLPRHF